MNHPRQRVESPIPRKFSLRRRLMYSAMTFVVFFSCVELVARLLFSADDRTMHSSHESLITTLGLPELNKTMEFDRRLFWRLRENLRGVRITGAIMESRIDFTVSTHGHLRNLKPIGLKELDRVLVLGDSCAFGLGVNDDQTWPVELQNRCDADQMNVEIINAGVPGYTAYQGRKFLEAEINSIQPDVVVACFGFNDSDVWSSSSDIEIAAKINRQTWDSLLTCSRAYCKLRQAIIAMRAQAVSAKLPARMRLSPIQFVNELELIRRLATKANARTLFVIWPYASQVIQKSTTHQDYQPFIAWWVQESSAACVDLIPGFIAQQEPLFIDHVHANSTGCRTAATCVFDALKPLMER